MLRRGLAVDADSIIIVQKQFSSPYRSFAEQGPFEGEYPVRVLASDGANLFTFRDETNYTEAPIDARGENIDTPWWGMPFRYFFTQSVNPFGPKPDPTAKLSYLGKEGMGGQTFDVVSVHGTQPMVYTARLYINATSVLQRTIIDFGTGTSPTATFSAELRNIKVNVPMRADAFRFTPPANAKLNQESLTDKMLAIGEGAPDFTLFSTDGTEVSLRAAREGMKATLVNFWFLACPPCRVEFLEFEKLYQEFHAKGFNIVAVDKADSSKAVTDYARETGLTFPILLGGDDKVESVFEQYRVSAFPSTYLLDAEGRVVYRTVGTDVEELRRELKEMGLD